MARTSVRRSRPHQRSTIAERGLVAAITQRIVKEFRPLQVILFGSRARGDAHEGSDFDLLIVMPDGTAKRDVASAIGKVLSDFRVSNDILVATPSDIGKYGDLVGYVYRSAIREGKVIYATEELPFAPGELMTDRVKREVLQRWLHMARADLKLAADAATDELTSAQACYMSQQAAEKYLKAVLVFVGIEFPLTHDLVTIWELVPEDWTRIKALRDVGELSKWAIEGRYVGDWPYPTSKEARAAGARAATVSAATLSDLRDHGFDVAHD